MEAFQQRVVDEATELYEKYTKLMAFLNSERCSVLSRDELDRMQRQAIHMRDYYNVLQERVGAF